MNELARKMLVYLAYLATLCAIEVGGVPSPQPVYYTNAGFISNPSIYTYTIANQNPVLNRSQHAHAYATNDIDYNYNGDYSGSGTIVKSTTANRNYLAGGGGNSGLKTKWPTSAPLPGSTALPTLPTQPAPLSGCNFDRLAVYKVVLHTYWTRELFPKHYPDWRPTAQWTKTIGRTHDASYALFHIGQPATPGVRQFAETGRSEMLDSRVGEQQQMLNASDSLATALPQQQQQQKKGPVSAERSIFDEFNVPAVMAGAGRSEAKFFVDSNHSLVSLMTRIVPSPDWFIGVDSFQLCVGGAWIDTVTIEMDPLDAGTDNGFTFTAPNWPTSPQGVIYRITSRYPAHPAGSFFYPKSKRLPPIATFQFIKLKEYELSEVFNIAEDDRKYETVKTQTHLESEHNHVEMNNELSASIERERQNEIDPQPTSVSERDRIRSKLLAKMNPMYNNANPAGQGGMTASNAVPKNDKTALMQNIANSYRRSEAAVVTPNGMTSPTVSKTKAKHHRYKGPRDCRVSHWSEWSACSKTCGIGEMHRYRKVIKHGKRGGRPCPALQESKWCGSEQACSPTAPSYFDWSNT